MKLSWGLLFLFIGWTGMAQAQQRAAAALGEGPWEYTTYEQDTRIRVSVVSRGLFHPWSMVFLPGTATASNPMGDALITEREGRVVRLLRNGQLQPEPVADLSSFLSMDLLFDIALHPDFANNGLIYFTYLQTAPRPDGTEGYWVTTALARGHYDGKTVEDIEDIFVADAWSPDRGGAASRITFAPDGTLYFSSSHRLDVLAPQQLDTHIGKVLRLNDDGTIPADNPFIGQEGVEPAIYSYGHRSVMGLAVHPVTGAMWELENGPQGGDEINILKPGQNYGWPVVTYGRDYDGKLFTFKPWQEGMEQPELFWSPSITVSSLEIYTGDKFPAWTGNIFVSGMVKGRLPGTGQIQRVVMNEFGEVRREEMLNDLHQRIRYIRTGPDGFLYLLTDENDGAVLRIEPADSTVYSTSSGAPAPAAAVAAAPQGEQLFPEYDCAACHQVELATVGPAYKTIANEYTASSANIDMLAKKVIEGGAGKWGDVPMAAHSGISEDQAKSMVETILDFRSE